MQANGGMERSARAWRAAQRERYHRVRVWANSCVVARGTVRLRLSSVMWAKLTRTPPPPFLRYPQLQRRYAPSRPAFSARIPSLIHGATDDALRGAVTVPANSTRCLSVLSIPAARSSAAPHAISMTAPNAAQWCVREDERLPLHMASERNVSIARLEGARTASPPLAITSLLIDPIFQIRCMIISFAQSWLILMGLNLVTQQRLQSLHKFPQHLLRVLIFVLPFHADHRQYRSRSRPRLEARQV
jgi:hypothetical protein